MYPRRLAASSGVAAELGLAEPIWVQHVSANVRPCLLNAEASMCPREARIGRTSTCDPNRTASSDPSGYAEDNFTGGTYASSRRGHA